MPSATTRQNNLLNTDDGQPNGNVIWAFDANHDDQLDTVLDTNGDGQIDTSDTEGGAAISGGVVDISKIRAVRIWLLVRTRYPVAGYTDTDTYVVGDQHLTQAELSGSGYKRILLTATVDCRNMWN